MHSFFGTPGGGRIDVLLCPAGNRKTATIAEFFMASLLECRSDFSWLLLSGKMCRFLHSQSINEIFGLDWRFVECDANLAGFGSAGCPALRAARFYVDFRAHFSMPCALSQIAN
ncbi:hypothetical protein AB3X96_08145 [Paraburkholderia sp. BR13439]